MSDSLPSLLAIATVISTTDWQGHSPSPNYTPDRHFPFLVYNGCRGAHATRCKGRTVYGSAARTGSFC
eukprot:764687-Hanusia_phi.AAC.6